MFSTKEDLNVGRLLMCTGIKTGNTLTDEQMLEADVVLSGQQLLYRHNDSRTEHICRLTYDCASQQLLIADIVSYLDKLNEEEVSSTAEGAEVRKYVTWLTKNYEQVSNNSHEEDEEALPEGSNVEVLENIAMTTEVASSSVYNSELMTNGATLSEAINVE